MSRLRRLSMSYQQIRSWENSCIFRWTLIRSVLLYTVELHLETFMCWSEDADFSLGLFLFDMKFLINAKDVTI